MSDAEARDVGARSIEARLRAAVDRSDAVLAGASPILRHLLADDDSGLFGDAVVARARGMVGDVAHHLAMRVQTSATTDAAKGEVRDKLTAALLGDAPFVRHVHALALEWQIAERLERQLGLDPVLSPLLQALIGSDDATVAELAMKLLAAQARFGQAQRRMRLHSNELPGELFHGAIMALRTTGLAASDEALNTAETALRADYREGDSRLGLLAQLITAMGSGAVAALSLQHAGAALFLSAVAAGSGEHRDVLSLAASDRQQSRLALALRAAALKPSAIAEQLIALDSDAAPPSDVAQLSPGQASAILAGQR